MSEAAYTSHAASAAGEAGAGSQAAIIGTLRQAIERIERHVPRLASPRWQAGALQPPLWQLGCPLADQRLPEAGLAANAVHEVKGVASGSGAAADWMTALGFALRLGVRRLEAEAGQRGAKPFVLWCWPKVMAAELGSPSAAGLAHLGLDPARLIMVETARAGEAALALEEGLKSGGVALVAGVLDEVGLTPARRLSLAAAAGRTPCLLVTHPQSGATGATATRWRIGREQSAAHPFDPRAPGARRFVFEIERCRAPRHGAGFAPLSVEWSDETHRFAVAAGLAGDLSRRPRAAGSTRG